MLSNSWKMDSIREEASSSCTVGELDACADAIEPLRQQLVDAKKTVVAYNDDIGDVVAGGPCRDALQDKEGLENYDDSIKDFDEALRQLRRNNPKPFQDLDTESDSDLDDPTPCRPA